MLGFYGGFFGPLRRLPMPVIAAVNGHAIGAAFAFAMAADIRVISETAKCSVNFTQLGLHPGMGATFTFPRTVPREVSNYMLLTGRQVQGVEAKELGLCLKTVPAERVLREAVNIACEIAANGKLAVRQTKESLDAQWGEGVERQLRREADAQAVGFVGPDFQARISALIAKTTGKSVPLSKL
jgi:enoyl-CoA hydratase/carnithine racemase